MKTRGDMFYYKKKDFEYTKIQKELKLVLILRNPFESF